MSWIVVGPKADILPHLGLPCPQRARHDILCLIRYDPNVAQVVLTAEARRQLDELPVAVHYRVLRILERLTHWPRVSGVKPLRGKLAGRYRIRTGDYRVQFYVPNPGLVAVEKIAHRDGFYDD